MAIVINKASSICMTTDYFNCTDYWLLTTDHWPLTTDYWLLTADYWLLTTDCWLLTPYSWLLTAYCSILNIKHLIEENSHLLMRAKFSNLSLKLDGVGLVDNRPSTNKLHHFVPPKKMARDTWQVTHDMWHVTRDTWHVTCDIFGGWTFSQHFSSLALNVCDLWYLEEKADLMNQLMPRLFIEQPWLHRAC